MRQTDVTARHEEVKWGERRLPFKQIRFAKPIEKNARVSVFLDRPDNAEGLVNPSRCV